MIVIGVFLLLVLSACEEAPHKTVNVDDNDITVYFRSFTIMCDIEKEMGIAYANSSTTSSNNSYASYDVGGMLTDAQYAKWCGKVTDAR